MAARDLKSQNLHDKVIQLAYEQLDKLQHDVYINPDGQRNAWIGDNIPDIIITEKGSMTPKFIIEVETLDTVNIEEATSQWKKYSTEIKSSFYLLVPLSQKENVINLCKQVDIIARFGTYQTDSFGNVSNIKYE
jgi:hypothetical protein